MAIGCDIRVQPPPLQIDQLHDTIGPGPLDRLGNVLRNFATLDHSHLTLALISAFHDLIRVRDVAARLGEELNEKALAQRFTDRLMEGEHIAEIPRQQREIGRLSLTEFFGQGRLANKADRNRGIHQAHMEHGCTLKQIADHLRLHYTTVRKAMWPVETNR